jgi:hypothetical protein
VLNQSDYAPKALALAFASRTEAYIAMKDGGDSPLVHYPECGEKTFLTKEWECAACGAEPEHCSLWDRHSSRGTRFGSVLWLLRLHDEQRRLTRSLKEGRHRCERRRGSWLAPINKPSRLRALPARTRPQPAPPSLEFSRQAEEYSPAI